MTGPHNGYYQYAHRRNPYQHQAYSRPYQPFQQQYQQSYAPIPASLPAYQAPVEPAEKTEVKEEKEENKDEGKKEKNGDGKKNDDKNNGQRRQFRRGNGRFNNAGGSLPQTNLAERAAREGVFKERTDFCKYHRMFGLQSNRCENVQTCGFYTFMEQKIPNTQLRPKTQEQLLMDQNKQQMQSFMVGLAGSFVEQLKELRNKDVDKQGANTNNALEGVFEFVMEVNLQDPEYLIIHLREDLVAQEEMFGEIRSDFDLLNTNNNNVPSRSVDVEQGQDETPNTLRKKCGLLLQRLKESLNRQIRLEDMREYIPFIHTMTEGLRDIQSRVTEQLRSQSPALSPLRTSPQPPGTLLDQEWINNATMEDLHEMEVTIKQQMKRFAYTFRRRTRQNEIAADGDPGNFLPTMRKRLNQIYQQRQRLYQEEVRRENAERQSTLELAGAYSIPTWTVVHQDGNVYT